MSSPTGTLVRICLASAATVALTGLGLGVGAGAAQAATPTCFGHRATFVGTDAKNIINGTSHADVIVALGGDDIIHGNGGDDLICAGEGADHVYGDAGDDSIKGGPGAVVLGRGYSVKNDQIVGGPGDDYVDPVFDGRYPANNAVPDVVDYRSATAGIAVEGASGTIDGSAGGQGIDQVVFGHVGVRGSAYADQMQGGAENDWFNGMGGADVLAGGLGDDQLFDDVDASTAPDADSLSGGGGTDTLIANGGPDTLAGGDGSDFILDQSESSSDRITGGGGDDELDDFLSRDPGQSIDGGPGNDSVYASGRSFGEDPVAIDLAAGTLTIGVGTGAVTSPFTDVELAMPDVLGHLTVAGTDGNDRLFGGQAGRGSTLIGRAGDDSLWGSDGDDRLDGGPGFDTGEPGGGSDTCISIEVLHQGNTCEVRQQADRKATQKQVQ